MLGDILQSNFLINLVSDSNLFFRFVNEECSRVMKGKGDHCFKVQS